MRQAKEIAGARRTCALLEGTPEACRAWRGQRLPCFVRSTRWRGSRLACREVAVMATRSVKRQQWTSLIFARAALLVFGASPARAGTETGASGLILVPSADTLAPGDAEFAVRYKDGRLGGSFTYGIFERIEIGGNNMRTSSTSDFGIVIKGAIFEETASEPAVSVGFETGQSYVVVSKRLAPRVRAHLGLGAGDLEGVFAGVALVVNTTTDRKSTRL